MALDTLKRRDEARADLDRASQLDSNYIRALVARARLLGEHAAALTDIDRAIELDPQNATWLSLKLLVVMPARDLMSYSDVLSQLDERADEYVVQLDQALSTLTPAQKEEAIQVQASVTNARIDIIRHNFERLLALVATHDRARLRDFLKAQGSDVATRRWPMPRRRIWSHRMSHPSSSRAGRRIASSNATVRRSSISRTPFNSTARTRCRMQAEEPRTWPLRASTKRSPT